MSTIRTPGVYVQEIAKFPPSIAAVETAIPAFIGYTQMATRVSPGDLHLRPFRIGSLLEYETYFGTATEPIVNAVNINEFNALISADLTQTYYLYDSLRLFFSNGGGDCYIISIGLTSSNTNEVAHYRNGLAQLRRVDEPTLILFPDAIRISDPIQIYSLQISALEQCYELKDRFVICDLLQSRTTDAGFGWAEGYQEFRNNIGVNNLSYGAAYTPYLETTLGVSLYYRNIRNLIFRGGVTINLANLTDSTDAQTVLINLNRSIDSNNTIQSSVNTLRTPELTIRARFLNLIDTFRQDNSAANFRTAIGYIYSLISAIDNWLAGTAAPFPISNTQLNTDITNLINDSLSESLRSLVSFEKGATSVHAPATDYIRFTTLALNSPLWGILDPNLANPPLPNTAAFSGGSNNERRINSLPTLFNIFEQIHAAFASIVQSGRQYESINEQALFDQHAVYRSLITSLRNSRNILPPSGAIAGIYAKVDNERGVFKAPANVSLNNVRNLTYSIETREQDQLNIDPVSGKSINAIRAFTGRGTLVWGARTLAGNDNEWKYISVRRFFIFAEESIKKATEPFVFEPNDANTWVKVRSMIENFLTLQWRQGALAGAITDEAFYVRVGLGQTMTAQDILNGYMIIEIGMAVVRPAEFIVLRFSHKMQES